MLSHMSRWVGEVIMDSYWQVKSCMIMCICIDGVFKPSNWKLKVISDACISSTHRHTGRLIKDLSAKPNIVPQLTTKFLLQTDKVCSTKQKMSF